GKDQDVGTVFHFALVFGSNIRPQLRAADRGNGLGGIVLIRLAAVADRLLGGYQLAMGMQIERGGVRGGRPIIGASPIVSRRRLVRGIAHDIIVNRFLLRDLVAFPLQYIVEPGHVVAALGQLAGVGGIFQLRYATVTNRRDNQPAPAASALAAPV